MTLCQPHQEVASLAAAQRRTAAELPMANIRNGQGPMPSLVKVAFDRRKMGPGRGPSALLPPPGCRDDDDDGRQSAIG